MRNSIFIGLIAILALAVAGCDSSGTSGDLTPIPATGFGTVTVQVATASGTQTMSAATAAPTGNLMVGFQSLAFYNHLDPMQVVELPVDPDQPVDLMAAAMDPATLLAGVSVPEGEYDCVSWEIASVEACGMAVPGMGPMAGMGDVCTSPFLVSDGDQVTVLIELPEMSLDCTTMPPSLNVGSGQATVTVR